MRDVLLTAPSKRNAGARPLKATQEREDWLAKSPQMPTEWLRSLETLKNFLSDYARFDVQVDELLRGTAARTLSVRWDNSTFSKPNSMASGPFVIALRYATSPLPRPHGSRTANLPIPEPALPIVFKRLARRSSYFQPAAATLRRFELCSKANHSLAGLSRLLAPPFLSPRPHHLGRAKQPRPPHEIKRSADVANASIAIRRHHPWQAELITLGRFALS
jgi:hypothetical protein